MRYAMKNRGSTAAPLGRARNAEIVHKSNGTSSIPIARTDTMNIMVWVKIVALVLLLTWITACTQSTAQSAGMSQVISVTSLPQMNNDCLETTGLIPGKTSKDEVLNLWGEPVKVYPDTEMAIWDYGVSGPSDDIKGDVTFWYNIVDEVTLFPSNCTLGDLVAQLGPPEIVELVYVYSCFDIDNYAFLLRDFHYPSQGVTFTNHCSRDTPESCSTFSKTDAITIKTLYLPGKDQTGLPGFNMYLTIIEWIGFYD